jgi:hypothetical protein
VTVKVLESIKFEKRSYEIALVVKGGGEGWFFEEAAGARKLLKKPS